MRYGVVAREEAYLERRFGNAYCDYKARVAAGCIPSSESAGPMIPQARSPN